VKSLLNAAGWILFLLLAVGFLLFYNFGYVPRADRIVRQQNEIAMWTGQVEELTDSLAAERSRADTAFFVALTFDELFGGSDEFKLTPVAESLLRGHVTTLQALPGTIAVIGHTDRSAVPARLRDRYPTNWEYSAARAGAVARSLIAWGIQPERIRLEGLAETQPAVDSAGTSSATASRRVAILVRQQ
jgi:flagellar motor protein MotB